MLYIVFEPYLYARARPENYRDGYRVHFGRKTRLRAAARRAQSHYEIKPYGPGRGIPRPAARGGNNRLRTAAHRYIHPLLL